MVPHFFGVGGAVKYPAKGLLPVVIIKIMKMILWSQVSEAPLRWLFQKKNIKKRKKTQNKQKKTPNYKQIDAQLTKDSQ